MQILFKVFIRILVLVFTIMAPGAATLAQSPALRNPLMDLGPALKATPGVLGVESARTESGKLVIFAWFENKTAALGWYYSDAHRELMKMSGAPPRPRGPMADIADDGRPIMAIASITLPPGMTGPPTSGMLSAVPQIAIELYAPLPGGLAAGGRFAPSGVKVPGLLAVPSAAAPTQK